MRCYFVQLNEDRMRENRAHEKFLVRQPSSYSSTAKANEGRLSYVSVCMPVSWFVKCTRLRVFYFPAVNNRAAMIHIPYVHTYNKTFGVYTVVERAIQDMHAYV